MFTDLNTFYQKLRDYDNVTKTDSLCTELNTKQYFPVQHVNKTREIIISWGGKKYSKVINKCSVYEMRWHCILSKVL